MYILDKRERLGTLGSFDCHQPPPVIPAKAGIQKTPALANDKDLVFRQRGTSGFRTIERPCLAPGGYLTNHNLLYALPIALGGFVVATLMSMARFVKKAFVPENGGAKVYAVCRMLDKELPKLQKDPGRGARLHLKIVRALEKLTAEESPKNRSLDS